MREKGPVYKESTSVSHTLLHQNTLVGRKGNDRSLEATQGKMAPFKDKKLTYAIPSF